MLYYYSFFYRSLQGTVLNARAVADVARIMSDCGSEIQVRAQAGCVSPIVLIGQVV